MAKFKPYDYDQTSMVVINFEEQLQPGTFEHAIHYLIDERLDLSVFHPQYKNDEGGRPAYPPEESEGSEHLDFLVKNRDKS